MRRNRIFVMILAVFVVFTLVMTTGCGKTLSGTYSAEALGSGVSMRFSGSRVTLSCKLVGAVVWEMEGTYEIKDTQITMSFPSASSEEEKEYSGTFDFAEDEGGIKIGVVYYTKMS